MDLSQQIDILSSIDPADFNETYFRIQKPVVIKGLADNTIAGKKWTIDHFKRTYGEQVIGLYDNSKPNSASANTHPDLKMKLGDFLDIISGNEKTDLRIFLYNMFRHHPELRKEFPCPDIFKGMLDHIGYMFFGGKDTTVRIHYDIDMSNVLHTHFGGRKRVVLIAPEYTPLLYCLPLNTYSLIDPDKPDYKKYPALDLVKGYDFILESGDSLFMPSGYWHYMTYLEGGFSVSYRRLSPSFITQLKGFLNICLHMPVDKLLNRILGSNWLEIKKHIAEERANAILQREYGPVNTMLFK